MKLKIDEHANLGLWLLSLACFLFAFVGLLGLGSSPESHEGACQTTPVCCCATNTTPEGPSND